MTPLQAELVAQFPAAKDYLERDPKFAGPTMTLAFQQTAWRNIVWSWQPDNTIPRSTSGSEYKSCPSGGRFAYLSYSIGD